MTDVLTQKKPLTPLSGILRQPPLPEVQDCQDFHVLGSFGFNIVFMWYNFRTSVKMPVTNLKHVLRSADHEDPVQPAGARCALLLTGNPNKTLTIALMPAGSSCCCSHNGVIFFIPRKIDRVTSKKLKRLLQAPPCLPFHRVPGPELALQMFTDWI